MIHSYSSIIYRLIRVKNKFKRFSYENVIFSFDVIVFYIDFVYT